jgi:threonine dehydrogenase-like Zn-dependent dehydrogenase
METAINLVQDGAPILGERVLVLGQGVVGLLTASLLSEFPLETLVAADCYGLRRELSPARQSLCLDPNSSSFHKDAMALLNDRADLTFELSGRPETLNDALALTGFGGRIVIGSWYGEKRAEIDLGGTFHRSRIKLISSQVSTIAPELSGRWDKARRFEAAWKALERVQPEKWITHRFPLEDAKAAYHLLDENPQEAIQVVVKYSS